MIGAEDNLEGGEDDKRGGSQKSQKGKMKMSDCDEVGSLQNMMMIAESKKRMTAAVEDMKVGDPVSFSRAGLTNGGVTV